MSRVWLATALLLLPMQALAEEKAWVEAHDDDGIKVWYRDRADLGGRQIKAEIFIEAPPDRVFEVLSDVSKYTEFMPYLEKLEVLETLDDGRIQYEVVNAPVVSRRDYVLQITVAKVDAGWRIDWKPAPEGKGPAATKGTVRVTLNEGSYLVAPQDKGTLLSYTLLTHPGGSIPTWIAKRSNTSAVPDLLDGIRRRVKDPTWKR